MYVGETHTAPAHPRRVAVALLALAMPREIVMPGMLPEHPCSARGARIPFSELCHQQPDKAKQHPATPLRPKGTQPYLEDGHLEVKMRWKLVSHELLRAKAVAKQRSKRAKRWHEAGPSFWEEEEAVKPALEPAEAMDAASTEAVGYGELPRKMEAFERAARSARAMAVGAPASAWLSPELEDLDTTLFEDVEWDEFEALPEHALRWMGSSL